MASIKSILRNMVRPREGVMTLNSKINRVGRDVDYNPDGVDVLQEDWDTLIILDACRYDTFRERHELPGKLGFRISRGGGTVEFLRGNFRDRKLLDTVYVTANPQIVRHQSDLNVEFHEIVNVWQEGWDSSIQNCPPDVMTRAARDAVAEYPDKRLILHYNQPHGPFLGPTADDLVIGPNRSEDESLLEFVLYELRHDLVSSSEWRVAMNETFDIVHGYIADLLEDLSGRTVVTSDHGEMLGERGWPVPIRYNGHQIGIHREPLVKVPWLVYEKRPRPKIRAEAPSDERSNTGDANVVTERLRDLGYV